MTDCQHCPVERDCHYPYKPCDCFNMRKFWSAERRIEFDRTQPVSPTTGGGNDE